MGFQHPLRAPLPADAVEAARITQERLAERDPASAHYIADLSRFYPDNVEHHAARARLDAHLALVAAETADRNGRALTRATIALAALTGVLAVATIVLIIVTARHA